MKLSAFLAGAFVWVPLLIGQEHGAKAQGPLGPAPVADSSFVGSQTCKQCHASTHSSWTNGRHSKMLQDARSTSVIPAFDRSLTLRGKRYQLSREGESYFIVERYLQEAPTKRRVDYTLGSRRVQHYLSRLSDGRIVVLPPSYDVEKKEWFHNLDIVDLEESGEVKVQVWNSNCYGCHVSGEQKGFDPATKTFKTTWTDFGTSCERCHGPGKAHATKYTARGRGPVVGADVETQAPIASPERGDRNTAIVHPRRLDPETSTTLCAQCHTLRDITQPGFSGGLNYYDYFTPLLEYAQKRNRDPAYWPNGRPRRFSNEAIAFWQSQCYFKGGATCLSCHTDVHEPDIERNDHLALRQDGLCVGCHNEIAEQGSMHSRHAAARDKKESSVSCVSCHMPRTTISLRHRMPDHTISIPAPENTKRFSIPNACNECHKDRSADWSESHVAKWFPNGRRQRTVDDAIAFSLGARKDRAGVERLVQIAGDVSRPPLFRANAVGHLRNYGGPLATTALLRAAKEAHPAIRVAALLSLTDQGRNPAVRRAMEASLKDGRRIVRMASVLGLLNTGPGSAISPDLSDALAAAMNDHENRARFLNDDSTAQLDLGKMFFLMGNWKSAESSVRDALRLDPQIEGGAYFLGLATLGQGRVAEGAALLRSVDQKDPHRKDAEAVLAKLPLS